MGMSICDKVERFPVDKRLLASHVFADYLGVVPYGRAIGLQEKLVQLRAEGAIPDVVLLLEHPPVFTTGRFRGEEDIIASPGALVKEGIVVFHTNRGGSVTYHGLGQLVGYPILDLRENHLGVRQYIWKLEEVIIRLLYGFGIEAYRVPAYPGVWARERKVCSIGVCVTRHVTMHGLALNVNTDLKYFEYINPCGIKGEVMTSISKLVGQEVEIYDILGDFFSSFSAVFGLDTQRGLGKWLDTLDVLSG